MLDHPRLPTQMGSHTGGKSSQGWTLESPSQDILSTFSFSNLPSLASVALPSLRLLTPGPS